MSAAVRRVRRTLGIVVALLAGACGHESQSPTAPPPEVPPDASWIAEVTPPARSTGNPDDVPIAVRFARDPDPASLSTQTVFFKLDTARQPVTVEWDGAARVLHVHPVTPLRLRRTYTVVLSAEIRDSAGERMGTSYNWQFKTNSLRHVQSPRPLSTAAPTQSPFATLRWGGLTEATAGAVEYDVRTAGDSLGAQSAPVIATSAIAQFTPLVRWSQDAPVWWSVEAHNLDTGERLRGPSWVFSCLPPGTPVDTVDVPFQYWAWRDVFARGSCLGDSVVCADNSNGFFIWSPGPADSTLRLAGAILQLSTFAQYQSRMGPDVTVWPWAGPLVDCTLIRCPGPPFVDVTRGALASGEAVDGGVRLSSDAFTAHVEKTCVAGDTCAYFVRHPQRATFRSPLSPFGPPAHLRLVVYRPNAVVPPRAAPGRTAPAFRRRARP